MQGGWGYYGYDPSQYSSTSSYAANATSTTPANQQQQYATGYLPASYPIRYQPGSTDTSGQTQAGSSYATYAYANNPAEGVTSTSQSYGYDQDGGVQSSSSSGGSNTRRRQQNRLAQRALRQRKETHLRDLESRIINARFSTRHLEAENEELERQLQQMNQENEYLRTSTLLGPYRAQSAGPSVQGYGSLAYDLPGQTSVSEPSYTPPNLAFGERVDAAYYDPNLEQESEEHSYGEEYAGSGVSVENLAFYDQWQRSQSCQEG
jgi:hypothetical protein